MCKFLMTLITALVLISTGCEHEEFFQTKNFTGVITHVDTNVESSNIVVSPAETETSRVEVDVEYWGREPDFKAWVDGTTLKVDLDCHPDCDGEVTLLVPMDVSVSAETGSGNIKVRNIEGNISASTGSGNIGIDSIVGNLSLETGSGNISGSNLISDTCDADTGSGNVKLTFNKTPLDVNLDTGSGNVKVTVPYGSYDIELDTGSGNTTITGLVNDPKASDSIRADTGSGNITVQAL